MDIFVYLYGYRNYENKYINNKIAKIIIYINISIY